MRMSCFAIVIAISLGMLVSAWSAGPAFGGRGKQSVALVEQLKELERELIEARRQGNYAEVAEIKALMAELRQAGAEVDSEDGDQAERNYEGDAELRERLRELDWELKLARKADNELEVEEIQELMARLISRLLDKENSVATHVDKIEVNIDSVPNVKISSASCGFALVYSSVAESQLAIMEPADILVGSVDTNEIISIVVPMIRLSGPFKINAVAETWDDQGAEISFSLYKSNAPWHSLGNKQILLEVTGTGREHILFLVFLLLGVT